MTFTELEAQIQQAEDAEKAGNYDEAEMLANGVLAERDNVIEGTFQEVGTLRANAFMVLAKVEDRRGNFEQALGQANQVIALVGEGTFSDIKAKAWNLIGNVYLMLGNYDKALEYLNIALATHEKLGEKSGTAKVIGNIGLVYLALGSYDKALEYMSKALATHEELGEESIAARVTANIASVYDNLGNYGKALEYTRKSLGVLEKLGEKSSIARITVNIGNVYDKLGNYEMALKYHYKARAVFEELGEKSEVARAMGNIGLVYHDLGIYDKALEYMSKALSLHEKLGIQHSMARTIGNIGLVYDSLGNYELALEYYSKALTAHQELGAIPEIARFIGNIGSVYYGLGNYDMALENYSKALPIHEELGAKSEVALVTGNIGLVYYCIGNYNLASEYFEKARSIYTKLEEIEGVANVSRYIGNLFSQKKNKDYDAANAQVFFKEAIRMYEEIGAKKNLYEGHKAIAILYENEKRWEDFAVHFKKYHELYVEVQSEEATKQAGLMEHRRKIEESERDRQIKLARFQEQEKILHNILPSQIAERMIEGEKTIADSHEHVSVFFSDIVGFTKLSQQVSAQELVGMLNGIFSQFDQIARKHGLEKIKTIGDAYMAVCGAPIHVDNHAERAANFALDVAELMNNYQISTGDKVMIRIGLHSGSVVAGIIGESKFAYDMWGDAVNTASRMESHGEPGKIHVSEEFKHAVETLHATSLQLHATSLQLHATSLQLHATSLQLHATSLQFIRRGEMTIKGKGIMNTYFMEKR